MRNCNTQFLGKTMDKTVAFVSIRWARSKFVGMGICSMAISQSEHDKFPSARIIIFMEYPMAQKTPVQ